MTSVLTNSTGRPRVGVDWSKLVLTVPGVLPCDFTGDGACDAKDIDLMQSIGPIRWGIPADGHEQFDLNVDGVINLVDRDQWLLEAAAANGLLSSYRYGDADLDGVVDGSDFLAWNAGKFTPGLLWSHGNFNADGAIDGDDFILWNANKFTSSDLVFVPEPKWYGVVFGLICIFRRLARQ